jgi:malonyl CoA-acyl carrier protein transacylase
VWVANYNAPGQVVVAGTTDAIAVTATASTANQVYVSGRIKQAI